MLGEYFVTLGASALFCRFYSMFHGNPVSKNADPDKTPHHVASDLGLHCLPVALFRISK